MSGAFSTNPIPVLTAKDPLDIANWLIDFSNTIGTDTIATVVGVTTVPTGLTVGTTAILAGIGGASKAVGAQLSGGSIGTNYTVSAEITTTDGNQFSRSFILPVQTR